MKKILMILLLFGLFAFATGCRIKITVRGKPVSEEEQTLLLKKVQSHLPKITYLSIEHYYYHHFASGENYREVDRLEKYDDYFYRHDDYYAKCEKPLEDSEDTDIEYTTKYYYYTDSLKASLSYNSEAKEGDFKYEEYVDECSVEFEKEAKEKLIYPFDGEDVPSDTTNLSTYKTQTGYIIVIKEEEKSEAMNTDNKKMFSIKTTKETEFVIENNNEIKSITIRTANSSQKNPKSQIVSKKYTVLIEDIVQYDIKYNTEKEREEDVEYLFAGKKIESARMFIMIASGSNTTTTESRTLNLYATYDLNNKVLKLEGGSTFSIVIHGASGFVITPKISTYTYLFIDYYDSVERNELKHFYKEFELDNYRILSGIKVVREGDLYYKPGSNSISIKIEMELDETSDGYYIRSLITSIQ